MKNLKNMLLILSTEEREGAEEFVLRKLKLLNETQVNNLKMVSASARTSLEKIRAERGQLNASSKAGKVMARIYDSALAGYARFITECNRTIGATSKPAPPSAVVDGDDQTGDLDVDLGDLAIDYTVEDEEHAWQVIQSTLQEVDRDQLKDLRDACEQVGKWWQSDGGLQSSLHVHQYGDVNSGNGRMAIRKAREEMEEKVMSPLRGFFETVNLLYQKKDQAHAEEQRRLRQEAGL